MDVDILMITYNRPAYTRMSLWSLLESCDDRARVWVWHNGNHAETIEVVQSMRGHPRFHRFHHSEANEKLTVPTNWLWDNAPGQLVAKVDDDCLVSEGWVQTLRQAHEDVDRLGVVACWHFQPEDFRPKLSNRKIREYAGGHRILRNMYVQGSGHMLKIACVRSLGPIEPSVTFPDYCSKLASRGWVNGWYYPLVPIDHMDDPRSPRCMYKTDADLAARAPLTAQNRGDVTLADWVRGIRRNAYLAQAASPDPRDYVGMRKIARRAAGKLRSLARRLVGASEPEF